MRVCFKLNNMNKNMNIMEMVLDDAEHEIQSSQASRRLGLLRNKDTMGTT